MFRQLSSSRLNSRKQVISFIEVTERVSEICQQLLSQLHFSHLIKDAKEIGTGVQVGIANWEAQLETNKQAYELAFVQRPEFVAAFPVSLTAQQFVDKLDVNAGGVLSTTENAFLVSLLGATPADNAKRAQVLRALVEDSDLKTAEFNKSFVLMQYFGYLHRDPNSGPDTDFAGYNFWLNKLNSFGGNFASAEMVKAFLVSAEYRQRFGSE